MIFSQRHPIRNNLKPVEMTRYICNPQVSLWRDVIEDYLYISKKRYKNKLSMFKLQLNILEEIINNIKIIDRYKESEKNLLWMKRKEIFRRKVLNKIKNI